MNEKSISKKRIVIVNILAVVIAAVLAILSKIALPSDVNVEDFDSIFVKLFGFPVVAVFYFLLIYSHCAFTMQYFGRKSDYSKKQIGIRFGVCFALIYFIGMQEVIVEATPYKTYGIDFLVYQFFMGIGEALAALCMCYIIASLTIKNDKKKRSWGKAINKIKAVVIIAAAFTIEKALAYKTGLISSDIKLFPVPCYLWAVVFGLAMGCCYVILYPLFNNEKSNVKKSLKIMVVTVGINWCIFNMFMALIYKNTINDIAVRVFLDIAAIFLSSVISGGILEEK